MLRQCLVLSLVLSVAVGYHVPYQHQQYEEPRYPQQQHHQQYQQFAQYSASNGKYDYDEVNVMELIQQYGYEAENHTVQTTDGYKLDLIRIPRGRQDKRVDQYYQGSSESSEEQSQQQQQQQQKKQQYKHNSAGQSSESNSNELPRRPPVLLMPGIISSADDFVLGGPESGLAFILADRGFDVFLGSVRGSKYGRKHTTLDPDRDGLFWNFCMDDMAIKDLPETIDRILVITRESRIRYLGHMQGAALFYAMASEMPRYNDKVRIMVTLGPLAFLGRTNNLMVKEIRDNMDSKGWVVRHLGTHVLKPSEELISKGGGDDCSRRVDDQSLCRNMYFLLNGYESKLLNTTSCKPIIEDTRVSGRVSVKEMLQLGYWAQTGRFTKHCRGTDDYNLSKVTTPIVMFNTHDDMMSTDMDVKELVENLSGMKRFISYAELTNNLDLLFGNRIDEIAYDSVIRALSEMY
ncbi:hypothetical protein ILUMI_00536 [Ignelater luminosus]|uniref:Partial AB-hydrolase lipase domain-containing protein n=1 Tax=Ignelater luminosus TaxID=2038154 RepID=A0A8K0DLP8_IGNLU|nr:hypothetical protein ILUMI_00536 [Ignelater luminosus]